MNHNDYYSAAVHVSDGDGSTVKLEILCRRLSKVDDV